MNVLSDDIILKIKKAGLTDSEQYLNTFLDIEDKLVDELINFSGLKSDIYLSDINKEINYIKFASIFSDFTSVFTKQSEVSEYKIRYLEPADPKFQKEIKIPLELIPEILIDSKGISPGYLFRNSNETIQIFKKLGPLIDNRKVIVRPSRLILVSYPQNQLHKIFHVHPDTKTWNWNINSTPQTNSIPIGFNKNNSVSSAKLFEVTVPYLKGISISDFATILKDEHDLLSGLRKSLKELIMNSIKNNETIEELKNDVIRIEIDKINRKFNEIKNYHGLRVSAIVGSFTLSLILGTDYEMLSKLVGGTVLLTTLASSEITYKKGVNALKDNPYFLLWKISKVR